MLLTPSEWLERRFGDAQKRPAPSSVRRWLEAGELAGEKIGGRWFVEYDPQAIHTGSEIADRILKAS